jgi:rSAM/selenodomain-associated transferase 1
MLRLGHRMTRPRLIIFARYPEPGRAKTRLIPAMGPAGAARLQDAMTRHTLRQAAAVADVADAEVWYAAAGDGGGTAGEAMAHRYGGRRSAYRPQGDGGMGERLARATAAGAPAVVIGSDCPGLTADLLRAAFDRLSRSDVVLGPAVDGGYYLIGVRRSAPRLFAGIDWSTDRVLAQTRAAAVEARLSVALLPPLADVDVPDDLTACRGLLAADVPPPYAPNRVAITGATGCLGRHFVARLLATIPDVRVIALVRPRRDTARSQSLRRLVESSAGRVAVIEGDLCDADRPPESLPAAARRSLVEADGGLWHFAASTNLSPGTADAEAAVRRANVSGTAAVLRLLAASDRPGPLFHLSTAYVCGRQVGVAYEHTLDLAGPFRNAYEASKAEAEWRVRDAFEVSGLAGAVFRPSLVVGEPQSPTAGGGGVADVLAAGFGRAVADGRPLRLRMSAADGVNAVSQDWVSRALLALAPFSPARRTYHLTAPVDSSVAAAAAAAVAALGSFDWAADANPADWSPADRLADRLLRPYRPYFKDRPAFDRRNLELDAPDLAAAEAIDLRAVFADRAVTEQDRRT